MENGAINARATASHEKLEKVVKGSATSKLQVWSVLAKAGARIQATEFTFLHSIKKEQTPGIFQEYAGSIKNALLSTGETMKMVMFVSVPKLHWTGSTSLDMESGAKCARATVLSEHLEVLLENAGKGLADHMRK